MSEPVDPAPTAHTSESIVDEILEQSRLVGTEPRAVKQGLPASYRMRHDAHYVDELESRGQRVHGASPATLAFPSSVPVTAALGDLSQELEGLVSCFNLIPHGSRPLRERVGLLLADVSARRGLRHAANLRTLLDEPFPEPSELSFSGVIREACDGLRKELHITDTTLKLDLADAPTLHGDRRLLTMALQACADALLAMIEAAGRKGTLAVTGTISDDRTARCELRQDVYRLSGEQAARLADLEWPDRPGGIAAGIALAAASRIAKVHGGRLEMRREAPGCALVFLLPAGVSAAS
jgi:hypothetical protein